MSNLTTSPLLYNNNESGNKIKQSLILAIQRTELEPKSIDLITNDLITEFSNIPITDIQKAIRNGALGKYGVSYRFSSQIVCFWVREFIKEKNKKNIEL